MFCNREDTQAQEIRVKEEVSLLQEDKEDGELLQILNVNDILCFIASKYT